MDQVWEMSKAKGAARLVLIALADWADDKGFCYPGLTAIVRKTQLTKPGVIKILRQLQALGELQITVRGHDQPDPVKDDPNKPGGWQPTNYYRISVGNSVYRPQKRTRKAKSAEVVNPGDEVNGVDKVVNPNTQGGQRDRSHIRNKPSLEPSLEPSATAAAAAPVPGQVFTGDATLDPADLDEAFALAWNDSAAGTPLKPCHSLTRKRRRLIRARRAEHPLEAWRRIMARIAASSFCRGEGQKGFLASFDWLIGSPDPAVKALEGQYDDHVSEADLAAARHDLFRAFGGACPHTPMCQFREDCVEREARRLRAQRRMAS